MLMSELITLLTHSMEQIGNYAVKLTEDGTEALHLTSVTHVVEGDDHSFVLSAATAEKVEGAVHQATEGEIQEVIAEKMGEAQDHGVQAPEVDPENQSGGPAELDKENVTDDAGTTAPKE